MSRTIDSLATSAFDVFKTESSSWASFFFEADELKEASDDAVKITKAELNKELEKTFKMAKQNILLNGIHVLDKYETVDDLLADRQTCRRPRQGDQETGRRHEDKQSRRQSRRQSKPAARAAPSSPLPCTGAGRLPPAPARCSNRVASCWSALFFSLDLTSAKVVKLFDTRRCQVCLKWRSTASQLRKKNRKFGSQRSLQKFEVRQIKSTTKFPLSWA